MKDRNIKGEKGKRGRKVSGVLSRGEGVGFVILIFFISETVRLSPEPTLMVLR